MLSAAHLPPPAPVASLPVLPVPLLISAPDFPAPGTEEHPCRIPAFLLIPAPSFPAPGTKEHPCRLPALLIPAPDFPASGSGEHPCRLCRAPGGPCAAGEGKKAGERSGADRLIEAKLPAHVANKCSFGGKIKNKTNPELGSASQKESALHFGRRRPPNLCCQKLH